MEKEGGLIKVLSNNRITLPLEFRKVHNIKEGDLLKYVETDGSITIYPVEIVRKMKR